MKKRYCFYSNKKWNGQFCKQVDAGFNREEKTACSVVLITSAGWLSYCILTGSVQVKSKGIIDHK